MGIVYRAQHPELDRIDALKVISPEHASDGEFRSRFKREWKTLASLQHANIVEVYDAGEADGHLYIAMRYVEGSDLDQLLASGSRPEPGRALALLRQAAAALDAAHAKGLVHRDVKPANFLIDKENHVYLSDFGLAKTLAGKGSSYTDHYVGTPYYSSPEQLAGEKLNARTDVYSLGVVLFECLTGARPFEGATPWAIAMAHLDTPVPVPSAIRPELPAEIDGVIETAMEKDPSQRYASCRALVSAAQTALRRKAPTSGKKAAAPAAESSSGSGAAAAAVGAGLMLLAKGLWDNYTRARSSPSRPSAPVPASGQELVGTWNVTITNLNGAVSNASLGLSPGGLFQGRLTGQMGTVEAQGRWWIVGPGSVSLQGAFSTGMPWIFGVTFSEVAPNRLVGRTGAGEHVVWYRSQ